MYALTNEATDDEKDEFYDQLQVTVDKCNRHDAVIVLGDLNTKVGDENKDMEEIIGKHGLGSRNDNGNRLCDFCPINGLSSQERASHTEQPTKQRGCHKTGRYEIKLIT